MQMNEQVLTALEVLRNFAENDFEKHRIDVLEKDLTEPPKVEVIDDTHQKFNGVTYFEDKTGHYIKSLALHRAVWLYYHGELPSKKYDIHHKNLNPADNDISNLQLLTNRQHQKIHHLNPVKKEICVICGKKFIPTEKRQKRKQRCCSKKCSSKLSAITRSKPQNEKICPVCGNSFFQKCKTHKNQIYCSRSCYMKNRWTKLKQNN